MKQRSNKQQRRQNVGKIDKPLTISIFYQKDRGWMVWDGYSTYSITIWNIGLYPFIRTKMVALL